MSKESEAVFLTEVHRRLHEQLSDVAKVCIAFEKGLHCASRLLLLETQSPASRMSVKCGRRLGIPVVVVQHGVIADPESYVETDADRIAAWGPLDAAWFSSNLPTRPRSQPTGNPRYDLLTSDLRFRPPGKPKDIPKKLRRILFASAPFGHLKASDSPWEQVALQSMVVEAVNEIPDSFLVFKRHPAEPPGPIPSQSGVDDARISEVVGGDVLGLIRASEVVITLKSSVALEAMYLGRPTIFLGPFDQKSPFHPPEDGAGLRVRTRKELSGQVRRLLSEPGFRDRVLQDQGDYLRRCFAPLDGHAADRVAAFLREK